MKTLIKYIRNKKVAKQRKKQFHGLYDHVNGFQLSQDDRGSVFADDFSLVYGEVQYTSFLRLLEFSKVKKNEVFYDLGSGTGKAVVIAALTNRFSKCVGIELLPSLYKQSQIIKNEFERQMPLINSQIEFINGDFFEEDFLQADVIFINATGFFGEELKTLIDKLSQIKKSARVIITSKLLPEDSFQLLLQDYFAMSWGRARVSVYERKC